MSRSNQTELINPADKFIDWSGATGSLQYFDKTQGEKGENVTIPLPFKFMVLDRVSQVTGGIDRNGGYEGFWSNAIRNTKTQELVVRSKAGVEVKGLYEQIKGYPGVKFMTGLYIAYYEGKTLRTGYLKIKGAALTAWIEFTKHHRNIYEGAFSITGKNECKKGTNTYYEPIFAHSNNVSEETELAAQELDKHLQEYLTSYFAQSGQAVEEYQPAYIQDDPQYSGQPEEAPWNPSDVEAPEDDSIPF